MANSFFYSLEVIIYRSTTVSCPYILIYIANPPVLPLNTMEANARCNMRTFIGHGLPVSSIEKSAYAASLSRSMKSRVPH